jgi:hypothetical protein
MICFDLTVREVVMSGIERHRGLLKLSSGPQGREDVQHIFSSVGYARSLGYDTAVDQLWLSTRKPVRIMLGNDPNNFMMTEVLDESSAPAIAAMEIDEMLGDNPTEDQKDIRDTLGLVQGAELDDDTKDMLRGVMAETLRGMGGVALISDQTLEGLAVARGFYEDTRNIGR